MSTLIAAMATASRRPLLIIECPPDGGVFSTRWGWHREPGLVEATTEEATASELWQRARPWTGTSRLLAGDPSAITMSRSGTTRFLADRIADLDRPALIDLGRLQPDDATVELLRRIDRLWLVLEGNVEQATAATTWRPLLERTCSVEVVLAPGRRGDGHYDQREVSETLGWPVIAELVHDRRAAAALRGVGAPGGWLLARLPLVRQAGELMERVNPEELADPRAEVGV
ncbi:hypothetical protein [Nitriliruptor alkaliphilus]|uniref:hypothetical protein n=1 Tax=Nitriliruptor alkaliphilus TaxID=427918 RepID=UPI0012ED0002|nr:hypothetical protein [Nitriliruptor alkaliphilus]